MTELAQSEHFEGEAGVRLHLLRRGDPRSRLVLLLHGGGANAHWWDHLAPTLAEEFHVVALDFRGHGDSDHPDEIEVGAFERDLAALLRHLGSRDPVLIGHSMGAHVAMRHAAESTGARAVVAIECSRGGGKAPRRVRLALAARRTYASRDEAVARFQFLPAAPLADPELLRAVAEHSVRREPNGRFGFKFDPRWFGLAARPPTDLARIPCPVLVIRGGESALLTPEAARALVAEIPDGRLLEVAGAGHNVQIESPGAVLAAVQAFLNELPE